MHHHPSSVVTHYPHHHPSSWILSSPQMWHLSFGRIIVHRPCRSSVCAAQFQWDGLGRDQIPTAAVLAYGHPNVLGPWAFYKQGMEKNGLPPFGRMFVWTTDLTLVWTILPHFFEMSSDQLTRVICCIFWRFVLPNYEYYKGFFTQFCIFTTEGFMECHIGNPGPVYDFRRNPSWSLEVKAVRHGFFSPEN